MTITREDLIILAGLSATTYPEDIKSDGSMYRSHDLEEIVWVKKHGVKITKLRNGSFHVIVGGPGPQTT